MKKINNKGMTLVELIVSFILVSVAMLYFFQTLRTVQKVYDKSIKQTNTTVNFDYAFRIVEAAYNSGTVNPTDNSIKTSIGNTIGSTVDISSCAAPTNIKCYNIKIPNTSEGKTKKLYLYDGP